MKAAFFFVACIAASTGCAVNPDADKAFREERRSTDSVTAVERGVQTLSTDTGQYSMPTAPTPDASDMPVINPADSRGIAPK